MSKIHWPKLAFVWFVNLVIGNFYLDQAGFHGVFWQFNLPFSLAALVLLTLIAWGLGKPRSGWTLAFLSLGFCVLVPVFGMTIADLDPLKGLFWGLLGSLAFWSYWAPLVPINFFLFRFYQTSARA